MFRRVLNRSLICGLVFTLLLSAGCAHQREPFFPAAKPGSLFAPRTSASSAGSKVSSKEKSVSTKPQRVEQSARRSPLHDYDEPFDFDQTL